MIQRVWDACEGPWRRVVLTSTDPSDDVLADYCLEHDMEVRRGSLLDVLSRYQALARGMEKFDPLVRVCGDAPFLRSEWIKFAIANTNSMPCVVEGALHSMQSWMWWDAIEYQPRPAPKLDREHAGFYWASWHGRTHRLVPDTYMTVNTTEELEEARRRWPGTT